MACAFNARRTETKRHVPVLNQLEHAAGFSAGDSDGTKLDKLGAVLAPSSQDLTRDVELFAELLSISRQAGLSIRSVSPQRRKELILEQLIGRVVGLAAQKPVLIVETRIGLTRQRWNCLTS